MSHPPSPGITALLLVFAAGCGDDSIGPEGSLTGPEAQDLLEMLAQVGSFSGDETPSTCPLGGTVQEAVAMGIEEDALLFYITLTYTACRARTESGIYTLDGGLDGSVTFHMDSFNRVVSMERAHAGSLDWRLGSRAGSCPIELSSGVVGSEATTGYSLAGRICDLSVETFVSEA